MSQVIPISQVNAVVGQPNTFQYRFPQNAMFSERRIAIANMILPYNWYNLSTSYANTTGISMIFPTGATTATINMTIPNGFYTITQLNAFLQAQMVANNFYLVNGSTNVYYLEIVANSNTGLAQLNCYDVPLTTTYTNNGWVLPTTPNQVPQLVITNAEFGKIIGFAIGTYPTLPTQVSTYSVQSTFQPQISPVSSIYVCLSCINNELSSPNNIVSVIPINTTFGAQIIFSPSEFIWVKALDGTIANITLTLFDQNMRALQLLDTNMTANILVQ